MQEVLENKDTSTQLSVLVCTWMVDRCSMSIYADSPSDETLNRDTLALLLRRQYEFSFRINIVQFSFFFFNMLKCSRS